MRPSGLLLYFNKHFFWTVRYFCIQLSFFLQPGLVGEDLCDDSGEEDLEGGLLNPNCLKGEPSFIEINVLSCYEGIIRSFFHCIWLKFSCGSAKVFSGNPDRKSIEIIGAFACGYYILFLQMQYKGVSCIQEAHQNEMQFHV